ncbi:hypothetical protein K469DRAFT_755519 [Zopfia rhizophila CBS 207.26]|uniref:Uncharacterized protein n=1 Tax=Zopfia rhizophila CBS 207.26 TaxID=1314779 RepID=A0A6A6DGF4_9PEZI|nr:hypothetical protein K469DRAFT_755519 [Zopfia rhizophila CBS 207.26]
MTKQGSQHHSILSTVEVLSAISVHGVYTRFAPIPGSINEDWPYSILLIANNAIMPNVISRVVPEQSCTNGQRSIAMDITLHSVPNSTPGRKDGLRRFPTEVRLLIFEELLIVWPKTVFRGAREFGPLDKKEFDGKISISCQILQTCRKYHDEAAPIMYGKNKLVFCTGEYGNPGQFMRFPINVRYMPYATDLGIYFRATDPKEESSKRVAHFIKAIARRGTSLQNLVVLTSSDRYHEAVCPWDIPFCDHPVSKALVNLVESKTVRHLKLRVHNGACFFPGFASFLKQIFEQNRPTTGRSITFTRSCTCPNGCPLHPANDCFMCGWPKQEKHNKPIEEVVPNPILIESCMERMMDMQSELYELGILPPRDNDEDEDEDDVNVGPYSLPPEDDYEEKKPAFESGLYYNQSGCFCVACSNTCSFLPGQFRRYRSVLKAPAVWYFRQTKITEFFKFIEYEEYLDAVFDLRQHQG